MARTPRPVNSPSWARVQAEIQAEAVKLAGAPVPEGSPAPPSPFDVVRRRKLADLATLLNRPVVVYAVECLGPSPKTMLLNQIMGPVATMIEPGDRDAFAEVTEQLSGDKLAVVIQSPGGYAETTEALVGQLRSRFGHIQAVVPVFAKSAATMLALSADELLLDEHSELGPIDPQFTRGSVVSPAQGILDQFKQATEQIKEDPATLPAWAPILQQYAPSQLQDARQALDLAREMVTGWLESYMFHNRRDAHKVAERVARYFAGEDPKDPMRSHSRPIGIDRAKEIRLRVRDMRRRAELQRCVRELHHAVNITLSSTQAYKLVENSHGQSYIRGLQVQANVQVAQPLALPPAPAPSGRY